MAEKYGKLILSAFLAAILLLQTVAFLPVNAQEPEPASVNPDPANWYTIVNGNLATDTYDFYPYETDANTKIGFSRFGEMINSQNNVRVGMEYRDQDVFAPPAGNTFPSGIPPSSWLQGWLINITYNHPTQGMRNVWATAQHADTVDLARNWLRVDDDYEDLHGATVSTSGISGSNDPDIRNDAEKLEDPADEGCLISLTSETTINCNTVSNGGRKTNGTAISGPIEVLYDGPRRYVAVTHTVIYDLIGNDASKTYDSKPLVTVVFTIDYNKVTKEVNVIKDVKMAEQAKFTIAPIDIKVPNIVYVDQQQQQPLDGAYAPIDENAYQTFRVEGMLVSFSNRGEFDLKADDSNAYDSFVHFYTYAASHINDTAAEILPTVYNNEYTLLRTLPPQTTIATNNPFSVWGNEPASITTPVDGKTFGTFDVAQIISSSTGRDLGSFVAWAAFWPSLSDWDVDGGRTGLWYQSLEATNPHRVDTTDEPFRSPYIIGEWDFLLTSEPEFEDPDNSLDGDELEGDIMFRGVSQYGLVDRHDELVDAEIIEDFPVFSCENIEIEDVPYGRGSDGNAEDSLGNILDPEVAYYLKMKFCPWDLVDAANKETQRHVQVIPIESSTTIDLVGLMAGGLPVDFDNFWGTDVGSNRIIGNTTIEGEEWRAYSTFAERIIVFDASTNTWELLQRGVDYIINDTAPLDPLDDDTVINFEPDLELDEGDRIEIYFSVAGGSYEWTAVGRDSNVIDSAAASMVTAGFNSINGITTLWAAMDMRDTTHLTGTYLHAKFGAGNARGDYHYDHPDDHRSALKKYWSTTIPIASSNIISVGGPGANLVTEYSNEFMPAIYRGSFFNIADLLLVPSWDALGKGNEKPVRIDGKTTQSTQNNPDSVKYNITDTTDPKIIPTNEQDYGWAVVSTYKDINGTVFFNIWGATGNDSFWAAQVFQNGLSEEVNYKGSPITLQKEVRIDNDENGPDSDDALSIETLLDLGGENSIAAWLDDDETVGVTTLILWIEYTDEDGDPLTSIDGGYHPRITIVEELGTISEIPQHDP